jgi:hypothetical protein
VEEKKTTIQEDISAFLSDALLRSNNAKGVLVILATNDDTIWTSIAGDLVTKLGLLHAAVLKGTDLWGNTQPEVEDEK